MKDYLVILAGLPRGGELSWKSLEKNVINHLNADLAICTENTIDKSLYIYTMADYLWLFEEKHDWLDYYKENYSNNSIEVLKKGKGAGLWESGVIHFALKDFILKNYLEIIKNYRYIIYSRFDQFYTNIHPAFTGENIWIPNGEDYFGINDRHAVLSCTFIEDYLNICNFVDSIEIETINETYLNCETVYKMQLKEYSLIDHVVRFERFQFTSAIDTDFTRWRVPKYSLMFNKKLKIKYPDEFLDAVNNSKFSKEKRSSLFLKLDLLATYYYMNLKRRLGSLKNNLLSQEK